MVVRITPVSRTAGLDDMLDKLGLARFDNTAVMVADLQHASLDDALPRARSCHPPGAADYARIVGTLRGSPKASSAPMLSAWRIRRCRTRAGCSSAATTRCWSVAVRARGLNWWACTTCSPTLRPGWAIDASARHASVQAYSSGRPKRLPAGRRSTIAPPARKYHRLVCRRQRLPLPAAPTTRRPEGASSGGLASESPGSSTPGGRSSTARPHRWRLLPRLSSCAISIAGVRWRTRTGRRAVAVVAGLHVEEARLQRGRVAQVASRARSARRRSAGSAPVHRLGRGAVRPRCSCSGTDTASGLLW